MATTKFSLRPKDESRYAPYTERCSFSDEELQILQECETALLKFKKAEKGVRPDPNVLIRVVSMLSRIFFTLSHFDEIF